MIIALACQPPSDFRLQPSTLTRPGTAVRLDRAVDVKPAAVLVAEARRLGEHAGTAATPGARHERDGRFAGGLAGVLDLQADPRAGRVGFEMPRARGGVPRVTHERDVCQCIRRIAGAHQRERGRRGYAAGMQRPAAGIVVDRFADFSAGAAHGRPPDFSNVGS